MPEITNKIKNLYRELGFNCKNDADGNWGGEIKLNENEKISVDFGGTVYVYKGFNKYGKIYVENCVKIFMATTPAQIEVLVKPLLTR